MTSQLENCPLFAGIESEQQASLFKCLAAKKRHYKKDEMIFCVGEAALFVGIVLSGSVNIIQEDFWGNRVILGRAEPGELFGEAFSCAEAGKLPISVLAVEASEIMLIDYRKIITVCSTTCTFHARLIFNMLQILASKNIMLTNKIGYISKRTTREKILAYLSAQAKQAGSDTIHIPFNRQELADYLCVERSALSRELSNMKKEGLLDYNKNQFILV